LTPIRFTVIGIPQPKGSAKIVPLRRSFPFTAQSFRELLMRVAMTSDNANVKAWQKAIATAAQRALGGVELELSGGVAIEAVFYFMRPKSHKKQTRRRTCATDTDKLRARRFSTR
jgi:hypothetical protein